MSQEAENIATVCMPTAVGGPGTADSEKHKPKRPYTIELHSRAVERVISAIRGRLDESISLREMAAIAYMSRYHFIRTFRQVTGVPPRRFLSALRVEAATRMLLNSNHSVTDICLDVGYSSLGTFIRRFSAVLGISPMRLRMLRRSTTKDLLGPMANGTSDNAIYAQPVVMGRVLAPSSFSGPIFIGLFSSAIPEGVPVACSINLQSGSYLVSSVPPGRYYVLALGLPWPDDMNDYFRYETALRGGELVTVGDSLGKCPDINLRVAVPTDPPILLNLPSLLRKYQGLSKPAGDLAAKTS
jgi:AraC family transcriptional regulator